MKTVQEMKAQAEKVYELQKEKEALLREVWVALISGNLTKFPTHVVNHIEVWTQRAQHINDEIDAVIYD
jgi:hypothetical protein